MFLGPQEIQDLLIPNPLSGKLEFWNKVLESIYNDVAGLISTQQIKIYILEQRISRWNVHHEILSFSEKVNRLVYDKENEDGNAKNVQKFISDKVSIKKGDLSKCKMAVALLNDLIKCANKLMNETRAKRSSLFDQNNNVKQWQYNELGFFDEKIEIVKNLLRKLEFSESAVLSNLKNIERKACVSAEQNVEEKRKLKRKKENTRKSEKRKDLRMKNRMEEVIKKLTNDKMTFEELKETESKLELSQISFGRDFTARLHGKALDELIKKGFFADNAILEVTNFHKQIMANFATIKQKNSKAKKAKMGLKKQKSITDLFFASNKSKEVNKDTKIVLTIDDTSSSSSSSDSESEIDSDR